MSGFEVASAELRMLCGKWQTHATRLRVATPPQSGLPCQPSAAAVHLAHLAVEVAMSSLIGRMTDTAARVATADTRYTANEADSAEELGAVGRRHATP